MTSSSKSPPNDTMPGNATPSSPISIVIPIEIKLAMEGSRKAEQSMTSTEPSKQGNAHPCQGGIGGPNCSSKSGGKDMITHDTPNVYK